MAGPDRKAEALALLSRTERELVAEILQCADSNEVSAGIPERASDDSADLQLAQLRLRNMMEKHSEALKRARLAVRSGASNNQATEAELRLWICSEALEACRRRLGSTQAGN